VYGNFGKPFFQRNISSPVHVRYMLNFEPDKKKMPELFSKRSGRLYGKVYNKSEKTSINTRKKEIDIGKSDKKTTELLFKSLI
jgi:hypothetical protein